MNADGKGWQTISEDDVDTWTSKKKKVTVLDCMAALFDAVLDDASYDRARSLRGNGEPVAREVSCALCLFKGCSCRQD